jgi:hypothetical protein
MLALAAMYVAFVTACDVYVDQQHGKDSNSGFSPDNALLSVAAAQRKRHAISVALPCTVHLSGGVHFIDNPPLKLNGADANTTFSGAPSSNATLSAGKLVPNSCWRNTNESALYACTLPASMANILPFRTLYNNRSRYTPARFPDYDGAQPYTGGWLFLNTSRYLGQGQFVVGIATAALPHYAFADDFHAKLHIFPTRSWINIVEMEIKAYRIETKGDLTAVEAEAEKQSLRHFLLQCPPPANQCTNTSNSASIGPGNRFFMYGSSAAISVPNEWHYNSGSRELLLMTDGPPPTDVIIPAATTVVMIDTSTALPAAPTPSPSCEYGPIVHGRSPGSALSVLPATSLAACQALCCSTASCLAIEINAKNCYLFDRSYVPHFINDTTSPSMCADRLGPAPPIVNLDIELTALAFAHTDYQAVGYQEGWSAVPSSPGLPRDAAVVVAAAARVRIHACDFLHLSGGGVHVTNGSSHVNISSSRFLHLGQSGVSFDGASTAGLHTKPSSCAVVGCTMTHVGEILASAAGVIGSTVANTSIISNVISYSSRWGVHIRSNGRDTSTDNIVADNRLSNLAQLTRDLGGLSFIGAGHSRTVVRGNCVREVVGMDTSPSGEILRPYYTFG